MSPSWRERFEIVLRPHEITVRRLSRGWRPKEDIAVGIPTDADPIHALEDILDGWSAKRRVPAIARLVLTESFCRHALIPWTPEIRGRVERAALLKACFQDLYGEAAFRWEMAADRGEYGQAVPAIAVDAALLKRIRDALASRRIALHQVAPFFAAVFNKYRHRFVDSAVLAVLDSGWAGVATFYGNRWNSVRSIRFAEDNATLAISREGILQGLPENTRIFICSLADPFLESLPANAEMLRPWGTIAQPVPSAVWLPGRWPQ